MRSRATRSEKLGYKIREAGIDKVPYIIVVGEKEQAEGSVSVRRRDAEADKQDLGAMKPEDFLKLIDEEMK